MTGSLRLAFRLVLPVLLIPAFSAAAPTGPITPLPDKVAPAVPDRQDFITPDRVQLTGWVGSRIAGNETNRLVKIDPARLLEGYRKRPGRQSWDGEHVGKWLHAATLAWVYTGDPALRTKLDATVVALAECQLEDGYLGTYEDKNRWTEWDVWSHKYNLIGLLTYMRYTGNTAPLATCRRMADYLVKNLGDGPGQRGILTAGRQHVGMATTSVLEPMVLLYRLTGEQRYLDFCHYIVRAWEQPGGPHIISRLLERQGVDKVGNGKAYEMLSCLNGALELYRATGERRLLDVCLNAWQDIVDRRLYLTGAASVQERFLGDHELPNMEKIGETCVTVTWLQFNAQLLRLTGEARFAEQLERVVLNQLLGAQLPDCTAWGYYVQMEGRKPYSASFDGHCCLSSGPRGLALIPTFAVSSDADGLVVNLYDAGIARLTLRDGSPVSLTTETLYPSDSLIRLKVGAAPGREFMVKLRLPDWCPDASAQINGVPAALTRGPDGYAGLHRAWMQGDTIDLTLPLAPRVIAGGHLNAGKAALLYGPLVLAADEALIGTGRLRVTGLSLPGVDPAALGLTPEPAPDGFKTWPGAMVFRVNAVTRAGAGVPQAGTPVTARLVPFADAGAQGSWYRVWLPLAGHPKAAGNLLLAGRASASGPAVNEGNSAREGLDAINDDNPRSIAIVGPAATERNVWFAVSLPAPAPVWRIVFVQGPPGRNTGWFDAAPGRPLVEIQRQPGDRWEPVGELPDYPATTAVDNAGLQRGQHFELRLPSPVPVTAVRVTGRPAGTPGRANVACGEIQAFSTP